jgi:hypothetical protein
MPNKRNSLQALRAHSSLFMLLLAFVIVIRVYEAAIPTYEGPDETEHVAYVLSLRQSRSLPNPLTDFDTALRQQASQSPLYYMLMAGFSRLLPQDYDTLQVLPAVNPWRSYPVPRGMPDNRNAFLMSDDGHRLNENLQRQIDGVYFLRLLSPLFGVVTIGAVYAGGLLLWDHRRWALLAAVIVAFTPQLLQSFSIVNNDNAVIAFGAMTLTSSLYLMKHPQSRYAVVIAGLMMGLAALSKANGVLLFSVPILALSISYYRLKLPLRGYFSQLALLFTIGMLFGGWWYARSLLLYGDLLGVGTHQQTTWAAQSAPTLATLAEELPNIIASIWANFGWYSIYAPNWVYLLPVIVIAVSIVGWTRTRWTGETLLLLLTVVIGLLSLIAWLWVSTFVPGRLFLPFYPALVLWIVSGLRRFEGLRIWWAGMFGALAVVVIGVTLYPAFARPQLMDEAPQGLNGTPLDFGDVQFLGYRLEDDILTANTQKLVKLCWQAKGGDTPVPVPYAFALHVPDANNRLIAARDSYPGMGKYTLWEPGKSFCDRFYLPVSDGLAAGRVYPILVKLYDYETKQELTPVEGRSVVGYLRTPADTRLEPFPPEEYMARFEEGILLVDAQQEDDRLTLMWGVVAAPKRTLKAFVHVVDEAGEILTQSDIQIGGETYPSWAWNVGEQNIDTVQLSLPEVEYDLVVGLYDAATLERLAAFDREGNPLINNALVLQ